jgi:hypothetical protein
MGNYKPSTGIKEGQPLFVCTKEIEGIAVGDIGNMVGCLAEVPNHSFLGIAFVNNEKSVPFDVKLSNTHFEKYNGDTSSL